MTIRDIMREDRGVFRLAPAWVPRSFCRPGRRLKLHPDDYYKLGLERGGIDERWLSSATHAENGPLTPNDEGLSYIVAPDGARTLLRDALGELKEDGVGPEVWKKYGRWPMYSKFFDNMGPLPHHIHHDDAHAARVNQSGKPEMYFFPAQMNNHGGEFPFTFFGLNPGMTRERVRAALEAFACGDNHLTDLSRAYRLTVDTGWDVPPGVLHAPGSLCTYEPQFASDVFAMYQSVLPGGQVVGEELLWKDCPPEERGNVEYLLDVIDWEKNLAPDFDKRFFMAPVPGPDAGGGCRIEWICYRCREVGAQRITVAPGASAVLKDEAAYGLIFIQGRGTLEHHAAETPAMIRFGQLTRDEYFVTYAAASKGVKIVNKSDAEELVALKHFALHPDQPNGL